MHQWASALPRSAVAQMAVNSKPRCLLTKGCASGTIWHGLHFTHLLTLRFNGLLEPQLELPSAICQASSWPWFHPLQNL